MRTSFTFARVGSRRVNLGGGLLAVLTPAVAHAQQTPGDTTSPVLVSLYEFWGYVTSSFLWEGALLAVQITALAMVLGLAFGLGLALMRLSNVAALRGASAFYIWFIRGTPLLLQLIFIFDALPLIGLRFDSFSTAVIGFALNEAAFSAEIIRGGILAVNSNQWVAASAYGLSYTKTLRRIILPQAMRAILPGIGNDVINMLKMTSLASVIFVAELTYRSQQIVGQNFRFFTVFGAAALIYLAMTSLVAVLQSWLEAKFDFERDRTVHSTGLAHRLVGWRGRVSKARPTSASQQSTVSTVLDAATESPAASVDDWRALLNFGQPEGPAGNFVQIRNVQKAYGERTVLDGIDLTIAAGEVVAILGPSGSGKSTLLRTVNHLETIDWGEILVDGSTVGYRMIPGGKYVPERNLAAARAKARIAMVFQHFNLFSHLTAVENVMEAPIQVLGMSRNEARDRAETLLRLVGLGRHFDHMPFRLSGGQQQRVAIARALAIEPKLILFDEPTSALDPELVGEVLAVMRSLASAGLTMLVVTHEIQFARDVADRVVFIDDGRVVEQGPASEVLDNPSHDRTKRFLRIVDAHSH